MTQEETDIEFLREIGAFMTGHYVGTQGLHMSDYIETEMLLPYVYEMSEYGHRIALQVPPGVDLVIGISNGILAHRVADSYRTLRHAGHIQAIHTHKGKDGEQRFRDHWVEHLKGGRNAFVVEDVIHAGKTTAQVCRLTKGFGADVLGVGALWNRGGITAKNLEVPMVHAVINFALPSWTREECAIVGPCSRSEPVDRYWGHGKEFHA